MKLQLTEIELSLLADLCYAGNWVINSQRLPDEMVYPYKHMYEKIAAIFSESGIGKKENGNNGHTEDELMYQRVSEFLTAFNDRAMLETLAYKLAELKNPANSYEQSSAYERYLKELQENGLINVTIAATCDKEVKQGK